MKLTLITDGREALPARAIPWVAGYEQSTGKVMFPPSLLILSAHTTCRAKDTVTGTPLLCLYRIGENGARPVSVEYLNATAPESDFQPESDEPLRESTSRLPAGVFVFLDELRTFVDWLYPPGCFDGECRDTVVLNTSPDLPAELLAVLLEGFFTPKSNVGNERQNPRKILFRLAPNEILIPADQVPGAIADALYPRPGRDGGLGLNDPDTVPRLLAEREHANMLRMKFPHLKEGDKFSIGDLNDYLARLGMMAELRHRSEALAPLDTENRWSRRQFEDSFNAVRETVVEARRCPSELTTERCTELAGLHELFLDHWIELVGLGIGRHESYDIGDSGATFRNWQDEYISAAPIEWQSEMKRDNRTAPRLEFPCTPAELIEFVDTAIGNHCFMVPDAFRLAAARNAQAERERCNELATLPELFVHHWEELTGIGICKGEAYIVSQSGVFPEQYSDDELRLQTTEERRLLLESATRPPLLFPCTPNQLLKFVDGGGHRDFEVPDDFRTAVKPHAPLVQIDSEQNANSGTPEVAEPPLVTKAVILAVSWPMPPNAPPLEKILNERPKWVSEACVLVGKPGGGASGSHLWKPAVLALCLTTTTPHQRWRSQQSALTNFLRNKFPDNFAQWEGFAENL